MICEGIVTVMSVLPCHNDAETFWMFPLAFYFFPQEHHSAHASGPTSRKNLRLDGFLKWLKPLQQPPLTISNDLTWGIIFMNGCINFFKSKYNRVKFNIAPYCPTQHPLSLSLPLLHVHSSILSLLYFYMHSYERHTLCFTNYQVQWESDQKYTYAWM